MINSLTQVTVQYQYTTTLRTSRNKTDTKLPFCTGISLSKCHLEANDSINVLAPFNLPRRSVNLMDEEHSVFLNTHTHTQGRARTRTHTHAHTRTGMHTRARAHTRTHTRAHTRTHPHTTHTHTTQRTHARTHKRNPH